MEKSSISEDTGKTLVKKRPALGNASIGSFATILGFVVFVSSGAVGIWYLYSGNYTPPEVAILNLSDNQLVLTGSIELRGIATDNKEEIKAIMVSVDNGPTKYVIPAAENDFSEWSIVLPMASPGKHLIEMEVVDRSDNIGMMVLSVIARDGTSAIKLPENLIVEATESLGAIVNYAEPVIDDDTVFVGSPICSPLSGSLFPLGKSIVHCTATVADGNTIGSEFSISVYDTIPPTITPPPDIIAKNSEGNRLNISLGTPLVIDAVDQNPLVASNAPVTGFAEGTTSVMWTAIDDSGNMASAIQKVTVLSDDKGTNGDKGITYSRGGGGGGSGGSNGDTDNNNSGEDNESPNSQFTITINSVDTSGKTINGLMATVTEDGDTVQNGKTPLKFTGNSRYRISVSENEYLQFDHWDDGSTSSNRRITLDQDMTITAYFSPINLPSELSVEIVSPDADSTIVAEGNKITVNGRASQGPSAIEVVEVRIDDGAYVRAIPNREGDWSSWSMTIDVTPGQHRLVPRVTDGQGNQVWNSIYVTIAGPNNDGDMIDNFGIENIYPTIAGGNEWYVDMDDPTSDPLFRNLPAMTKQSDGSWQVSGGERGQVRMEAWSPTNEKWLNVEITMYAKMTSGSNELLQLYSRGGHHTSSNECLGSAYKARFYGDGEAAWVKEVTHPAYAGNRGTVEVTDASLADRWIGLKAVIYNFVENGKTYVRMESYIDDDVTSANGNLVIRNNWKLASVYEDKGGWSTENSDFDGTCFPMNKDSSQQYRQRDEILNLPGGTNSQNIAAFRSDDLTWNWKYLSVREIRAP